MASTQKTNTTNSGIRRLSNGDSVIPSSTRADGSVRKEIKVKPGYKPPEDVEVYKNRTAEAWKNRGKGGIPGAAPVEEKLPPHKAAAAAKNAKRKEARKKAAAAASENGERVDGEGAEDGETSKDTQTEVAGAKLEPVPESKSEEADPAAEAAKEARKLAKKLRQARELKDKKDKGDNLLPEQFAKVIKIRELIRQLDALGFDAEGEKKESEAEPAG
jgi:partner of Y14 and mago